VLIGYARVSTEDLTAQRDGLAALGVEPSRIYVDHGRHQPGTARSARRSGCLPRGRYDGGQEAGRLARSLPDARAIAEDLTKRQVRLSLGASVYDPTDPVGRLLFNVLAMVAEFEVDLIRSRTREGMRVAKAKDHLRGKQPKLNPRQEAHLVELLHSGQYSTAELGDPFGVARSTVYRAVARSMAGAAAGRATSAAPQSHAGARPILDSAALGSANGTYRPRRGASSDLPSENRPARARRQPPNVTPHTGR
jgi:DNA invertase Pin-like site-specific DNA recombinase